MYEILKRDHNYSSSSSSSSKHSNLPLVKTILVVMLMIEGMEGGVEVMGVGA